MLTDAVIRRSVGETRCAGARPTRAGPGLRHRLLPRGSAVRRRGGGSRGRIYQTVAAYDATSPVVGRVQLPGRRDCKHVAAVLIAARQALDGRRPHRRARAGVGAGARRPGRHRRRAARIGRAPRSACSSTSRDAAAGARPFRSARCGCARSCRAQRGDGCAPGCRGGACSTTTTRSAIPRTPPRCARCTGAPGGRRRPGYYYGSGEAPVRLEEFGPALWPALQQAVDDGVTLLTTRGAPVRVAERARRARRGRARGRRRRPAGAGGGGTGRRRPRPGRGGAAARQPAARRRAAPRRSPGCPRASSRTTGWCWSRCSGCPGASRSW